MFHAANVCWIYNIIHSTDFPASIIGVRLIDMHNIENFTMSDIDTRYPNNVSFDIVHYIDMVDKNKNMHTKDNEVTKLLYITHTIRNMCFSDQISINDNNICFDNVLYALKVVWSDAKKMQDQSKKTVKLQFEDYVQDALITCFKMAGNEQFRNLYRLVRNIVRTTAPIARERTEN